MAKSVTARRRGKSKKLVGGAPKLAPGWSPGDRWGPGANDVIPGASRKTGRTSSHRGNPPSPVDNRPKGRRGGGGTVVGHTSTGRTSPSGGTLGQGRVTRGVPKRTGPTKSTIPQADGGKRGRPSGTTGPNPRAVIASRGRAGGTVRSVSPKMRGRNVGDGPGVHPPVKATTPGFRTNPKPASSTINKGSSRRVTAKARY